MLKKITFLCAFLTSGMLMTASVYSQSASLVDAGKKEGKAIVYGSLESDTAGAVFKVFKQKTGIEVEYWRASATKVMDRALSEYRAGPRYRNVVIGVVYNKSALSPADYPKSLEDLTKPQYRGKIVMPDPTQHTTTTQWVASLEKLMGKEKAEKYIRDLAATKPILVESLLPAAERVMTGETPVAITYVKYAYVFSLKGAPLDYVRLGKMMGDGHYLTLGNKAPHHNAGKALIDFFLGQESMLIIAKLGEFVNRKGVYPPLADADKIQFVEMYDLDSKQFAEKKKEYQQIFLR
jgi:ABC-type Fe3+ transport system substrate-binding protein